MTKPLVMVVDDEAELADVIASAITGTGRYAAVIACSGKEALDILKKNRPLLGLGRNRVQFIFLDIKMPEMDGLQLLAKVRREYGKEIGVAMLTAWEIDPNREQVIAGTVVNYIKKPFKSDELISTLDNYFNDRDRIISQP